MHICSLCGYEGKPKRTKRGSAQMEWIIYLTVLVPGPLYSLYRRIGLKNICPNCTADRMVRLSSDAGKIAQFELDKRAGLLPSDKEPLSLNMSGSSQRISEEVGAKPKIDPDVW